MEAEEKILGVIPARYGSSRFPGKPLVVIDGKTMIRRVYEQARRCDALSDVVVATDHDAIFRHVLDFGGRAVMTRSDHASGTERCAEACSLLEKEGHRFGRLINIQGDEPFIDPRQIDAVAACLSLPGVSIATLVSRIGRSDNPADPNLVKVVTDRDGWALYFSRAVIPHVRDAQQAEEETRHFLFRHIGIYGFRADTLAELVKLPPSPLETAEKLEQLRWLWNGYRIKSQITEFESFGIDSPADLLKITNSRKRSDG